MWVGGYEASKEVLWTTLSLIVSVVRQIETWCTFWSTFDETSQWAKYSLFIWVRVKGGINWGINRIMWEKEREFEKEENRNLETKSKERSFL